MAIDVDSCEVCKRMVNTDDVTSALQSVMSARSTEVHNIITVHKKCRKDVTEWRPEKCVCATMHSELKPTGCTCRFHQLLF